MKKNLIVAILTVFCYSMVFSATSSSNDKTTEIKTSDGIDIYPNPVESYFFVMVNANTQANIVLYDMTGMTVSGYEIEKINEGHYKVSTKHLVEGFYFVHVETANLVKTMRMLIK